MTEPTPRKQILPLDHALLGERIGNHFPAENDEQKRNQHRAKLESNNCHTAALNKPVQQSHGCIVGKERVIQKTGIVCGAQCYGDES